MREKGQRVVHHTAERHGRSTLCGLTLQEPEFPNAHVSCRQCARSLVETAQRLASSIDPVLRREFGV